jgi:hypothetical protein
MEQKPFQHESTDETREARRAAALRANLRRRKDQQQARAVRADAHQTTEG